MNNTNKKELLECEKTWVFALLMGIGGFLGAYTYLARGGVFCNAQTANFVLFAMSVGKFDWSQALYYLIPMSAYFLGTIVSEIIANPIKKFNLIRWDTLFIIVEIITITTIGFLPLSIPHQVSQIAINFICSMQYNTFRQTRNIPTATTFCTSHTREVGVALSKTLTHKSKAYLPRMFFHSGMIAVFIIGAIISTILCRFFEGKAIFAVLIPLLIILVDFLYADLKKEKGKLNIIPQGH